MQQINEDGVYGEHNESLIMHDLCIFNFFFVQKSSLTKIFFLFAEINLTTRGPSYTCLVLFKNHFPNYMTYVYEMKNLALWYVKKMELFVSPKG